ncbi:hypothetical protein M408DRAFT_138491 [Serendipita vermifera MAFF 305830]|uniref:Uncharacterized protein n=1 Tax=Serendipita vermifera MAFF 305830 TaxID=933852 RepID=A0A0C2W1J7_SERVB|nr:hypothetical protein M408DRAFT_138491 [Serendipita vermifera MAFF 305830]
MALIDSEPKPGTALKTIIKEAQYLDEFMSMIQKKLELEERYLNDLRALREKKSQISGPGSEKMEKASYRRLKLLRN